MSGAHRFCIALITALLSIPALLPAQAVTPAPVARGFHTSAAMDAESGNLKKRAGEQDFHVLALRVEFQQDTVATTTGNGLFMMEPDPDILVDPPPHNREYFEDHMEALSRYYRSASRGKVEITYEVHPAASGAVYKLPHQMQYYTPLGSEELLDQRLSELMRDALQAADQDAAIDFSRFNAFIIFHSGVGADYSIDEFYNPTPNDVPSVFLDFKHLKRTLADEDPGFGGIPVDDGAVLVREATILPETETKQGYEIGLNGIVAHQFGHQLGLPSLFNTKTGRQGIGQFGLMGVGFATLDGLLPCLPEAWSRVYLGWEEPVVLSSGENVPVYATLSDDPRRIYKIPISNEEYYLIENRKRDFAGDSLNAEVSPRGVLLGVDDYDAEIPGSGILIWHIDERIIARGLEDNTVNADPKMRGVDLEEADGAEDIGEVFEGALPGVALPNNGIQEDMYYAGNVVRPEPELTPFSYPSSDANSRAKSHISITNFSAIDTLMTFSVSTGLQRPGFPYYAGGGFSGVSPVSVETGDETITAAVTRSGDVIIFSSERESPLWGEMKLRPDVNALEDTLPAYVSIFTTVDSPVTLSPVAWQVPDEDVQRLAVVDGNNTLNVFFLKESELDGEDIVAFRRHFERPITADLMVSSRGLCLGDADGRIFILDKNGNDVWSSGATGSAVAGFAEYASIIAVSADGDAIRIDDGEIAWQKSLNLEGAFPPAIASPAGATGDFHIVFADSTGNLLMLDQDGDMLAGFPRRNPEGFLCPPALADIDGDGYVDAVIKGPASVYAYNHHGTVLNNFPFTPVRTGAGSLGPSQPLLLDVDGDGAPDVITGSADGVITAFNKDGRVLDDFPVSTGRTLTATPFLTLRTSGSGPAFLDIIAASDDRMAYYWRMELPDYQPNSGMWRGYLGDRGHSSTGRAHSAAEPPEGQLVLERGSVYNYPNPVENGLTWFRYKALYEADVTISVFDLVGERLESFSVPDVVAGIDNEIQWNAGGLETGVYIVKVEASAPNGLNDHVIFKMAVVK